MLSASPEALVEGIAHAAHGADGIDLAAALQAFAQAPDMDVDGALIDIDVAAPDRIEELGAAIDAARALHEIFEQAELGRRQSDVAGGAGDAPCAPVERDVAGLETLGDGIGIDAAQDRLDAG